LPTQGFSFFIPSIFFPQSIFPSSTPFLFRCANTLFPQHPQHHAATSHPTPPIPSSDQAGKMAPEPTPDHPEHKKKVNLAYVNLLAMNITH